MPAVAGTMQLSAQARLIGVQINPQGTAATVRLAKPNCDETASAQINLSFGTDSGEGDIFCAGDFDLTAGGTVTWDLFTGTDFKDVFGQTAAFRKLKAFFVSIVTGGDTAGVTIGDSSVAANKLGLWFGAVTETWKIYPSGPPMIGGQPAGLTVDATHKNVKITNNGAVAVTVRVFLGGSSV